jgi:hypothetical protein
LPAHGEYADALLRIVGRRKKGKSLDVVPVEVRENDVDDILGNAIADQFLTQHADAGSGIEYGNPVGFFTKDPDTGGIAPVPLKFSSANRQRTTNSVKFYFHFVQFLLKV